MGGLCNNYHKGGVKPERGHHINYTLKGGGGGGDMYVNFSHKKRRWYLFFLKTSSITNVNNYFFLGLI